MKHALYALACIVLPLCMSVASMVGVSAGLALVLPWEWWQIFVVWWVGIVLVVWFYAGLPDDEPL